MEFPTTKHLLSHHAMLKNMTVGVEEWIHIFLLPLTSSKDLVSPDTLQVLLNGSKFLSKPTASVVSLKSLPRAIPTAPGQLTPWTVSVS